ncbi:glycoside hydrolase family 9 protein [Paenibacillus sp. PR3]|uniref:Endoglucanase n=1 Tax=Paenibacillus terricola TaxID=2763503 RepID=A0ABR8MRA6_9BACL|nr:glycoside hydrolase family 9 protein [Paenibacillus terricola]MBD3918523.1 glycoside hydrolase family 9 protein [Paenibacillus terricola]
MKRAWSALALTLAMCTVLLGCDNSASSSESQPQDKSATTEQQQTDQTSEQAAADWQEKGASNPAEYQGKGAGAIHINQLGFRPKDEKAAIITSQGFHFDSFQLVDADSGEAVYTGKLQGKGVGDGKADEPVLDFTSGDLVYKADFTSVDKPGSYYVEVPGYGKSYTFTIGTDVYRNVADALLKGLYYQRCGTALEADAAGEYTHDACHLEIATLYEDQSKQLDVTGGWHDAGDYGRYSSPGANAVAFMLMGYELFPQGYKDMKSDIPQGAIGPAVLNEAKYELDWLLKMQDTQSGGVYHKVTNKGFEGFVMPETVHENLYVLPVSPTATGDFAAVMAMASRIYESYDDEYAKEMLAAAEKAWNWLANNPNAPGFHNPSDVVTGEYGDESASDETFWAAVELYRTTGKSVYHDYVKANYKQQSRMGLGWADMSGFGTISYAFMDEKLADSSVQRALRSAITDNANTLVTQAETNGFGIPVDSSDYYWGSNMGVMQKATVLIIANELQPNYDYLLTAHNLFDYLMGRNALDQSYVTGFGSKPVMNPHHRPSIADGVTDPVPGLVAGGPNAGRQDPTAEAKLPADVFPMKAYVDDKESYSTNEIAIYWNAPAIFVASYLAMPQQ